MCIGEENCSLLFHFISLEQDSAFNWFSLGKYLHAGGVLDQDGLLQLQANLFNGWLDKLRTLSTCHLQVDTIPKQLFLPQDILRHVKNQLSDVTFSGLRNCIRPCLQAMKRLALTLKYLCPSHISIKEITRVNEAVVASLQFCSYRLCRLIYRRELRFAGFSNSMTPYSLLKHALAPMVGHNVLGVPPAGRRFAPNFGGSTSVVL